MKALRVVAAAVIAVFVGPLLTGQAAGAAARADFGEITVDGSAVDVSVSTAGDTAGLHFQGVTGASLSLGFTSSSFASLYYAVVTRPGGATLVNTPLAGVNAELDLPALPQTGDYAITIDPIDTDTGTSTVWLSAEASGAALDATGATEPASITRPGQNARFTFAGATGQRLSLGFTSATFDSLY
ncbi:hypothetical protein, partial [Actinoplanes sp. NPDC051411]|uniref:hypothetical protein n=1 Tax=Actinoplanes sp. NPDC051411 TaxID=3155522 RepID=UPI0034238AFC